MNANVFNIAAVERDTGLSKDVLRVWERRYGFPVPERDHNGDRIYSSHQLAHLRLIKRLMDAGYRPGKLICVPIEELARMQQTAGRTATLGAEPSRGATADVLDELLVLIKRHQGDAFLSSMQQQLARVGVHRFVVDVVAPLSILVGQAWEQSRFAIFEEHLFSELTKRVLRQAIASLPVTVGSPRIVLTTVSNELHGLGLLMAEALLALNGAECIPLGTQLPLAEIQNAAVAHRADVVALSFSSFFPQRQIPGLLLQLRQTLTSDIALWVGGSAVQRLLIVPGVDFLLSLEGVLGQLEYWRATHPLGVSLDATKV